MIKSGKNHNTLIYRHIVFINSVQDLQVGLSIALLVLIGLVIVNCSKNQFVASNNSNEISSDEMALIEKIHQFLDLSEQQRQGVYLKSSNRITVDSAIYYIGVTIKYTYCFPTSVYNKTIWDTTYISFPVDQQSGDVLDSDVIDAYIDCVDSVRILYSAISNTTKKLISVVLQDLGTNANHNRSIRVIAQIGTGSTSLSILNSNTGFNEDDEYLYVDGSFKCDESNPGFGAPDILEGEILFKFRPTPLPGYHVWFEPGEAYTPTYYAYPGDGTIDNYCDYLVFYANSDISSITAVTKCLDYDQDNSGIHEMDFYLDGADYIVAYWLEHYNPEGKSFETCSFLSTGIGNPNTMIKHILNFTFAIKHVTPNGTGTNYPIPIAD